MATFLLRRDFVDNWLKYFSKEEVLSLKSARNLYGKAYLICERIFKGKRHVSGKDYFKHLIEVADRFSDEETKTVTLLHDIFKETTLTPFDLDYIGFPSNLIKCIYIMTRKENETYDYFIDRIISSNNSMALDIKKADIEQNMNLNDLDSLSDDYLNIINLKYKPQYEKILDFLKEREM